MYEQQTIKYVIDFQTFCSDSERDNVAEFRELIEAFFEARNVPELPVLMPCPISSSSL